MMDWREQADAGGGAGSGAAGGGAGASQGGGTQAADGAKAQDTQAADGKKGDGGTGQAEDVSGLKSALAKEREAAKELRRQVAELSEIAKKTQDATGQLDALKAKLGEYEFREKLDAAVMAAIEKARGDGFQVDEQRARKLAVKFRNAETLAEDVADVIEALKTKAAEGKSADGAGGANGSKPPIPGQADASDRTTVNVNPREWARMYRTDPEGYRKMQEQRAAAGKFPVM